jgi:hypothetical protein
MSLPAAAPQRQLKHRRQFDIQVYARGNGLWEVDATLSDVKTQPVQLASATREAGSPIHEMQLRLVINERLDVLEAGSQTRWMPYDGICDNHGDAYGRLVGLNLMRGFRKAALERLHGVQGCTHLTELALVLPTAVLQAFAGDVLDTRGEHGDQVPFQIDRCHALRSDGEAVRLHYPRWYRPALDARVAPSTPTED